jgi:hypothetical protein
MTKIIGKFTIPAKYNNHHMTTNHLTFFTKLSVFICLLFCLSINGFAQKAVSSWRPIFNGKDLKEWDTFTAPSSASTDTTPLGLNNDRHNVFTVSQGNLHVSGQDWGGVATKNSYSNYHLRFQIKWGEKKWAPRQNALMDGGLLFHCSLPYDYGTKCWMRSIEFQIQQGDMADAHNVGAGWPVLQMSPAIAEGDSVLQYDPFAAFATTNKRVYRSGNFESPFGDWTTGELVARGADAVFIINGFVVNRLYNLYRLDLHEQVTGGRIEFQSEGSEHYLRNIELRDILSSTARPMLAISQKQLKITPGQATKLNITNSGDPLEIIAIELLGKNGDSYIIKKPTFPFTLSKSNSLPMEASLKSGSKIPGPIILKLETVNGPVSSFEIELNTK